MDLIVDGNVIYVVSSWIVYINLSNSNEIIVFSLYLSLSLSLPRSLFLSYSLSLSFDLSFSPSLSLFFSLSLSSSLYLFLFPSFFLSFWLLLLSLYAMNVNDCRSASGGLAVYELSASDIVNMFELRDDRQGLGSLFHEGSTGFSISPTIDCLQLRPGRLQHLALLRGNI